MQMCECLDIPRAKSNVCKQCRGHVNPISALKGIMCALQSRFEYQKYSRGNVNLAQKYSDAQEFLYAHLKSHGTIQQVRAVLA